MNKVFISYSRKDLAFVEGLAADLKAAGLDVWYDLSGLEGGQRWRREIEKAIRDSHFVLVILSPDSVASEWVEREFLFAYNLKRKIIPLLHKQCDLPLNYLTLHFIDVQGKNYQKNFSGILRSLTVQPVMPKESSVSTRKVNIRRILTLTGIIFTVIIIGVLGYYWLTMLPTEISDNAGVQMLLVKKGQFIMGTDDEDGDQNERPSHTVFLDDYYIDKYEVTNALYAVCVNSGVCKPPKELGSFSRLNYYGNAEFDDYPVIHVDWIMATAFCEWRGARLPTEAEWEKAARGVDGRRYPWESGISCEYTNYKKNGQEFCVGDTTAVGSYPNAKSPYGVYDVTGNVFEWVADWYAVYPSNLGTAADNPQGPLTGNHRVLRGGAWNFEYPHQRVTKRHYNLPSFNFYDLGFRCARDAPP